MVISREQVLIDVTSTAIWNRNKIAMAMAIGAWILNIGFIVLGRLLLPSTAGLMGSHNCFFFYRRWTRSSG
jgi:hypothetical protein